jgi:hypothetical protein
MWLCQAVHRQQHNVVVPGSPQTATYCGCARQSTDSNIIRRLLIACWVTNARIHARKNIIYNAYDSNGYANAPVLCHVCIACLVWKCILCKITQHTRVYVTELRVGLEYHCLLSCTVPVWVGMLFCACVGGNVVLCMCGWECYTHGFVKTPSRTHLKGTDYTVVCMRVAKKLSLLSSRARGCGRD